jgi:hypothetical protein
MRGNWVIAVVTSSMNPPVGMDTSRTSCFRSTPFWVTWRDHAKDPRGDCKSGGRGRCRAKQPIATSPEAGRRVRFCGRVRVVGYAPRLPPHANKMSQ